MFVERDVCVVYILLAYSFHYKLMHFCPQYLEQKRQKMSVQQKGPSQTLRNPNATQFNCFPACLLLKWPLQLILVLIWSASPQLTCEFMNYETEVHDVRVY